MVKTLGWLGMHRNWLNITQVHALVFICLFYGMNLIYFFALSNDGRGQFAKNLI